MDADDAPESNLLASDGSFHSGPAKDRLLDLHGCARTSEEARRVRSDKPLAAVSNDPETL